MTTPMYTDKDYLDRRFTTLENMLEDTRGDVLRLETKVEGMQEQISSNRLEQVKAGFVATGLIGVSEFLRRLSQGS